MYFNPHSYGGDEPGSTPICRRKLPPARVCGTVAVQGSSENKNQMDSYVRLDETRPIYTSYQYGYSGRNGNYEIWSVHNEGQKAHWMLGPSTKRGQSVGWLTSRKYWPHQALPPEPDDVPAGGWEETVKGQWKQNKDIKVVCAQSA